MKNIFISLGQIPAKLDAVKYIGNKFQGGLMLDLADKLNGYNITICKWKYNKIEIPQHYTIVNVEDIDEYYDYVKHKNSYDAYILGAAVANLQPVNPWKGKFPSHNYKEGDEFNIKFKICPRIINIVKKHHPKSTLIGYKLSTGSYMDAFETLEESKADLVVYNNPIDLKQNILCYKTGLTQDIKRDELHIHIQHLLDCEIRGINAKEYDCGYTLDNPPLEGRFDLNTYFLFKELEKYVVDEDNHGSIFMTDVQGDFYTHERYNKYFASVKGYQYITDDLEIVKSEGKYTQALPIFLAIQDLCIPNGNAPDCIIHTHQEIDMEPNVILPYLPPNCSIECVKEIIGDSLDDFSLTKDNRIVIKSMGHGYFVIYKSPLTALKDFTDRDWTLYDPPIRYINDNTDIFSDVIPKGLETVLEIGDNEFPSKMTEELKLKRYNIDPYTGGKTPFKKYDILLAKNCVPIIGMKIFKYYTKLCDNVLFNFPKQYKCDRMVKCVSGDMKREISYPVNDKVFHSLMCDGPSTKEPDTFHTYDKITEKNIYQTFGKEFEIKFRYTNSGVWCLMSKKI